MAKIIKYNIYSSADYGTEEELFAEGVFIQKTLPWSEAAEKLARREAYNGVFTVEDDGRVKSAAEQIAELKRQLSATDYKVIKCAECQLLGAEMPYDVQALHAQRQAIRDRINALEVSL